MKMTEAELQDAVLEAAQQFGWLRAHFRPAKTKHGWRTPVQGDGKGFPDLLLVRGDRMIAAELKSDGGVVTAEQQAWIDAFGVVPGCEAYVWRPVDWPDPIAQILLHLPSSTS